MRERSPHTCMPGHGGETQLPAPVPDRDAEPCRQSCCRIIATVCLSDCLRLVSSYLVNPCSHCIDRYSPYYTKGIFAVLLLHPSTDGNFSKVFMCFQSTVLCFPLVCRPHLLKLLANATTTFFFLHTSKKKTPEIGKARKEG